MTARYWYMDDKGVVRGMEWRPVETPHVLQPGDEDRPLEPGEPEPEEAPDEADEDLEVPAEEPKTDEVPE